MGSVEGEAEHVRRQSPWPTGPRPTTGGPCQQSDGRCGRSAMSCARGFEMDCAARIARAMTLSSGAANATCKGRGGRAWTGRLPDGSTTRPGALLFPPAPTRERGAHVRSRIGRFRQRDAAQGRDAVALWEEYRAAHPGGYGYSRFCEHYGAFGKTLRRRCGRHRRGGATVRRLRRRRERRHRPAHRRGPPMKLFVAVLGASSFTFAQAPSEQMPTGSAPMSHARFPRRRSEDRVRTTQGRRHQLASMSRGSTAATWRSPRTMAAPSCRQGRKAPRQDECFILHLVPILTVRQAPTAVVGLARRGL